ncbi:hypothetical protein BZA05DRAFT_441921 [Tricharina praecox]|uniref:uncharacterized protein n=1 Tax=Tricharina praecox TaxID=43433 RepID=UPI002220830E|nr:uncharacterized protein BZA05DRAFT_441921 [Tricharina praecox]KAI5856231.1 hypothetical protein BZA05DRAFT_441921 [Tricharina praecox]
MSWSFMFPLLLDARRLLVDKPRVPVIASNRTRHIRAFLRRLSHLRPAQDGDHLPRGGVATGTRDMWNPHAVLASMLHREWNVISPDYSLLPQVSGLSLLRDQAQLEASILANAEEMRIDTNKSLTIKPKALLNFYGMLDLAGDWYTKKRDAMPVMGVFDTAFANGLFLDFLMEWHTSQRRMGVEPVEDSRQFVKWLRAAGVEVEFIEVPGGAHELIGLPADQGDDQTVAFLEKWVK